MALFLIKEMGLMHTNAAKASFFKFVLIGGKLKKVEKYVHTFQHRLQSTFMVY